MKKILIVLTVLLCPLTAFSQTIVFLDEGINTDQTLDTNRITEQRCRSLPELTRSENGTVIFASLCANKGGFHYLSHIQAGAPAEAAEYHNTQTIDVPNLLNGGAINSVVIPNARPSDGHPLRHGNYVSNAAWDFDKTLNHLPFTIFGINNETTPRSIVTSLRPIPDIPLPMEPSGTFIVDALDEIGTGTLFGEYSGVGAVNISVVIRGENNNLAANDLCDDDFGQTEVDLLNFRGIAVVVALDNDDVPSDRFTWPACLDGVIKVGSTVAHQAQNQAGHQIGIGMNGIDFFAQDTTTGGERGNSFAAPRVAAAYALLHRAFPLSSVEQKTEALNNASNLMSRYTFTKVDGTSEVITRRSIRSRHINDAIEFLGENFPDDLFPEQLIAAVGLDFEQRAEVGPFFDPDSSDQGYDVTIDLDLLRPITSIQTSSITSGEEQASSQVLETLPELSRQRDVMLLFTASRGEGATTGFHIGTGLTADSIALVGTTPSRESNSSTRYQIVIPRAFVNEGLNRFFVAPVDPNQEWGVSDVVISYLPDIELTVNETDTNIYGDQFAPTRLSGARTVFELANNQKNSDVTISMQGFDIDVANETAVFFNGTFLGHLNVGTSDTFSEPNTFVAPKSLLLNGANFIELVQREIGADWGGGEDEKWAVRDIRVEVEESLPVIELLPILLNFLLDEEE